MPSLPQRRIEAPGLAGKPSLHELPAVRSARRPANDNHSHQQPGGAVFFHSRDQRRNQPDQEGGCQRNADRAPGGEHGNRADGEDGGGENQRDDSAFDGNGEGRIVGGVCRSEAGSLHEGAGALAEERGMPKGLPSGRPDIQALVEVSALKLFRNGGDTRKGLVRDEEPESHRDDGQRDDSGEDGGHVAANQHQPAAHQGYENGEKTAPRSREQHADQAHAGDNRARSISRTASIRFRATGQPWESRGPGNGPRRWDPAPGPQSGSGLPGRHRRGWRW